MKAIYVDNHTIKVGEATFPIITLYADSAIGRDVMPLFVPQTDFCWQSHVCLALRIGRLGKNIAPKFAFRYVDAVGMVNVLSPRAGDDSAAFAASGYMAILDGAVTTGRWVETDLSHAATIDTEVCGRAMSHALADLELPMYVSLVSKLATLKTGDIIILRATAAEVPLTDGTYITAKVGDQECLSIKVKT